MAKMPPARPHGAGALEVDVAVGAPGQETVGVLAGDGVVVAVEDRDHPIEANEKGAPG